jgi:Uma2 family endonuclease
MQIDFPSPPRTIMEVYKMLPEGTLAELINGTIYMSPSPISNHQIILNDINVELVLFLRSQKQGKVLIAPLDVYLDESENAVQPDIIVLLNDNVKIIKKKGHIHGVPDLLVEVLSKGNNKHDLITKKDLYEKFGVKEYWVVDPETKLAIIFSLSEGKYTLIDEKIGSIHSPLLAHSFAF